MTTRTPTAPLAIPQWVRERAPSEVGTTAWASPPPAPSWRVYLVCLLLGDVGLILIAWDVGLIHL